jgi:hypothetical protein
MRDAAEAISSFMLEIYDHRFTTVFVLACNRAFACLEVSCALITTKIVAHPPVDIDILRARATLCNAFYRRRLLEAMVVFTQGESIRGRAAAPPRDRGTDVRELNIRATFEGTI